MLASHRRVRQIYHSIPPRERVGVTFERLAELVIAERQPLNVIPNVGF